MRLSSLALALAILASAASLDARRMASEAEKAERAGETVRAYLLYAQAAAADHTNPRYWAKAQALRPRAEAQSSERLPNPEFELATGGSGTASAPSKVLGAFTDEDIRDLERMRPPPRLKPVPGRRSYSLRADAKSLFEQIAKELHYQVIFDRDYNPANTPIRFNLEDADYRDVLHALESATNSFIVPISDGAILVAQDTTQKRTELENDEALAIPIPQRTSVQEAQELAVMVQQTLEIRRVIVDPQRRQILVRDRVSKVEAARAILEQLSIGKPQVALEVEFLSTGSSSSLSLGIDLPTQFPLVNFGGALHSSPSIPAGFMRFLTFGGGKTFFGIGITDAALFATASRSSASSVLRSTITASDGQAATLHVGDRYPIITGGYYGYGGGVTPGGPGTPGGVTDAVITTTPYTDQYSAPVSTTGQMRLAINGIEFPIVLTAAMNNLYGLITTINSIQTSVYASLIQRGTQARPLSMAVIANTLGISSISLIDDPEGAKIEILKPPDVVSSITTDEYPDPARTTVSRRGSMSLVVGSESFAFTLATEDNNLNGLRDAINAASAGVTASIRPSVSGSSYLQVVAAKSGSGAIQVYDDPDGLRLPLLVATDEVNFAGSQFGNTIAGSTGYYGSSYGGSLGVYAPPPSFNFEDLGLMLKVTPTVHGADEVTLDVEAEFKVLGSGSFNGVPVISTRKYQGKVRLKNSEWAVVAGLVSDTESKAITGLAGLASIPLLGGTVFGNTTKSRDQSNILIVIKPHVTSLPPSESVTNTYWIGSETRPLTPL